MGQVIPFPKRPADDRDRSALVEVHRCDQREALVVKGLFESEGIPVLLRSRIPHSVYSFTVGAQGEVVHRDPFALEESLHDERLALIAAVDRKSTRLNS